MKVFILSDINSAHTQKWCVALAQRGVTIGLYSFTIPQTNWHKSLNINVFNFQLSNSKIGYLKHLPKINRAISEFKPEIVHAHYATSYGLLGALSNFHPFVISAWGSDVMEFPNKSFLHRLLLKYNFKKADKVLATSNAIVDAVNKISNKQTIKTPFGIDTKIFKPISNTSISLTIGTVKSLETIYGIDILIKAYALLLEKTKHIPLKLLIVGSGSKEIELKKLVNDLGINSEVTFTGKVEYSQVVTYHQMIDIFVNVSRNESFGVSVLEASACGKPVIISNVGGLPEVVINNKTGLLIEAEDINALVDAIEKLFDKSLRDEMGEEGRKFVTENYDLNKCADKMIDVYNTIIENSKV